MYFKTYNLLHKRQVEKSNTQSPPHVMRVCVCFTQFRTTLPCSPLDCLCTVVTRRALCPTYNARVQCRARTAYTLLAAVGGVHAYEPLQGTPMDTHTAVNMVAHVL